MGNQTARKLTIYVDCVSPYSWFGFTNIRNFRPLLNAHGVQVEILPFFLGGARDSAGNPYSPTPQAKIAFASQDTVLTGKLLGLNIVPPNDFPISSLFAVRVATWVKYHYPPEKFEQTFLALASGYWSRGIDTSKVEGVIEALDEAFTSLEMEKIIQLAMTPENKKKVVEITTNAKAFGAPWIVAINALGARKDWFGNDRWDQVFYHLGVPYKPVSIIPPEEIRVKL